MRTLEGRLCLTGVVAMCALVAALPGSAGATVSVVRGSSYGSRIFPDNAFTVADKTQATGRRINFRQGVDYPKVGRVVQPACTTANYSICDAFAELRPDRQPGRQIPYVCKSQEQDRLRNARDRAR